jgi:hypothetical protein
VRRVAVALVLVAAGCGSSGGSSSLSHAELVKQADAICADAHAALRRSSGADAAIAISRDELQKLSVLDAGPDDRLAYANVLASVDRSVRLVVRARAAEHAGQTQRANLLKAAAATAIAVSHAEARKLGFHVCAQATG